MSNKNEKRLLVLGGGRYQLNLIQSAERRGIKTVISDYLENAPAKRFASYPTMTDALDIDANIALAKQYNVDGIITSGTDQALNTMAVVAHELGLPCYLTPESARICTHKNDMIQAIRSRNILSPASIQITHIDQVAEICSTLNFPLVIKPADAQGQRGISYVTSEENLSRAVASALDASRTSIAVAEEFVQGPEITVSAWLTNSKASILMITDRVTYNVPPALGVCFQHIFPSLHASHLADKVREVMEAIGHAYKVTNGPLYVQMIVNNNELYFIEGSCRVGGGHECSLIPIATGVNVTEHLIDLALSGTSGNIEFDFNGHNQPTHALVNFLLAKPGTIKQQTGPVKHPQESSGLVQSGFYYAPGYTQGPIVNALGRVGYFICTARERNSLLERAQQIYSQHSIVDTDGNELLFWPNSEFINGG